MLHPRGYLSPNPTPPYPTPPYPTPPHPTQPLPLPFPRPHHHQAWVLAQGPECRDRLRSGDVLSALTAAATAHGGRAAVVRACLGCGTLLAHSAMAKATALMPMLPRALAAVQDHPDDESVVKHALGLYVFVCCGVPVCACV